MTTSVGFTGTRNGPTPKQYQRLSRWLHENNVRSAGHGDCVGSDEAFHMLCMDQGIQVHIYPPQDDKLRAYCQGATVTYRPLPYLDRNQHIVEAFPTLLAVPKESTEPPPARGQGTWSTVRYAQKIGRRIVIFWPGGSMYDLNG